MAARDEEARIEQTMRHLLDQREVELEFIVVDDRSTDRTGEILQRLAAEDARVKINRVDVLPDGWLGKCHACHLGANAATGDWHGSYVGVGAFNLVRTSAYRRCGGYEALRLMVVDDMKLVSVFVVLVSALLLMGLMSGTVAGIAAGLSPLTLILPVGILARRVGWSWPCALWMPFMFPVFQYAVLSSTFVTLRQRGIRWRETFYALDTLRAGTVR